MQVLNRNSFASGSRGIQTVRTLMLSGLAAATLLACGGGGSDDPSASIETTMAGRLAAERVRATDPDRQAAALLAQMTLDEKIQLVHGTGFPVFVNGVPFFGGSLIAGIPRLGIPDLRYADSSNGVGAAGYNATPLPSTLALAASWDPDVAAGYGTLIGKELRTLGFAVGLGGGMNLAREPRGGRTFEYLGEDPILAGELMVARTRATQDQKVVATLKHFAADNQETNRTPAFGAPPDSPRSNSVVDERTLRELYLLGFEIATIRGEPGDVMCAYNKVNGVLSCENPTLLTTILKNEWGFKGVAQADWFVALTDTVRGANAGVDEEQPGSLDDYADHAPFPPTVFNQKLKAAVTSGAVSQSRLDDMVQRKLRTLFRVGLMTSPPPAAPGGPIDTAAGDRFALSAAQRSMVLLKNEARTLPLPKRPINVVLIGGHANAGVISGGGSAVVAARAIDGDAGVTCPPTPPIFGIFPACATWYKSAPLDAIKAKLPARANVQYFDGSDAATAANAAAAADVAIVFATQFTSEAADLPSLSLPDQTADPANQSYDQNALIAAVSARARRTVVLLETGTAVTMPWLSSVHAVLEAWYPGVKGGQAIADALFGDINPSGKLPLSFPKTESDLPQRFISQTQMDVVYSEGLKMGYRWYDAQKIDPLFAFGHGLSYTTFKYSRVEAERGRDGSVEVKFKLRNTGSRPGAEVAQVYAALPAAAGEPPQRLVAWQKVALAPGQAKEVELTIPAARFAIWNQGWLVPAGRVGIVIGGSSRDPNALETHVVLKERRVAHAE